MARWIGKPRRVATKRSAIDLVTDLDRSCERLIQQMLRRATPGFGFLGEESGERRGDLPYRWIVDPLDGTNNFVHGLPIFAVSIGLEDGSRRPGAILVGVIYDPMRRELFVASKGRGAFLNRRRLRVSSTATLSNSLLSTGFSSKFLEQTQPYLGWFTTLQRQSHGVRRLGSTTVSLAAVASGRLEGFYEQDVWPWDIAAGMLLVEEAGGCVTNFHGAPVILDQGRIIASNGHIHRELVHILSGKRYEVIGDR